MAMNLTKAYLRQGKTALLVCDLQHKFSSSIFQFDNIVKNSSRLVNCLRILDVPIIATEQNPDRLGPTTPELDLSGAKGRFPKTQFSMYTKEVSREISTLCSGEPPESIVLIGIAAHVCVELTALDLTVNGFQVHVVADCCSAVTQEERILAFERMKQYGCIIATSENVIYKLLADSNHNKFKELQTYMRSPSLNTSLARD